MAHTTKLWWIVAGTIVATGAALRIAGAWGGLWLDEIWSLDLIHQRAPTPFHVFWSVQHDNVHPLYGFYAAFLPEHPSPLLYRFPAILCGIGTIIVAGLIGLRGSKAEALIGMILVAFSYPFIHYSSEARGYMPMIFFVFLAFWLIEKDLTSGNMRRGVWVAIVTAAAVLSHLTAVMAVFALVLWAAFCHFRETGSAITGAHQTLRHLLPAAIALTLVLSLWVAAFAVNGYEFGGLEHVAGFPTRFFDHVGNIIKLMFGVPFVPSWIAFAVATVAAAGVIVWLFGSSDPRAPLYTFILFGIMGGLFIAEIPGLAIGRYYLFALVFLIPLAAQGLAKLYALGSLQRVAAVGLLSIFLAGSGWANAHFLAYGRGDARAALAAIIQHQSGNSVTVAVDHQFRFKTTFNYYAEQIAPGFSIQTLTLKQAAGNPPNWLVFHKLPNSRKSSPPHQITLGAKTYELMATFPHWGLSGFSWRVYRLVSTGATSLHKFDRSS